MVIEGGSPEEVAHDIGELVEHDPNRVEPLSDYSDVLEAFPGLLEAWAEREALLNALTIKESLFPVLVDTQLVLDLRVMSARGERPAFAPLVMARLTFDEPVQAGAAVSCQVSSSTITELRDQLTEILDHMDEIRAEFSERLQDTD